MASEAPKDYRELLLQVVASLTLCDHIGDVSNVVAEVLDKLEIGVDDWDELGHTWGSVPRQLAQMGVTTLVGTPVWSADDDDDGSDDDE
jgi:hypothetical protein